MKSKLQKWGNSLAIRIPKAITQETNIKQGTNVELELVGKKIVITPSRETTYSLKELLSCVNKNNVHNEIDTGPHTGKELW